MFDGIEVNGERITFIDGRTFVASRTLPGRLYETTMAQCECRGFQYRGRCRHVRVVAILATMPPIRPPAIPFMAEPSPHHDRAIGESGGPYQTDNEQGVESRCTRCGAPLLERTPDRPRKVQLCYRCNREDLYGGREQ